MMPFQYERRNLKGARVAEERGGVHSVCEDISVDPFT